MQVRYSRLYANSDGASCFDERETELEVGFTAPPAEPLYTAKLSPAVDAFWSRRVQDRRSMARIHNQRKRDAERRFASHVDVPVPPVIGPGNHLNEMLAWCRANFHADQWEEHGASTTEPGQIAVDYARFYFVTAEDAELFRWQWLPDTLAVNQK